MPTGLDIRIPSTPTSPTTSTKPLLVRHVTTHFKNEYPSIFCDHFLIRLPFEKEEGEKERTFSCSVGYTCWDGDRYVPIIEEEYAEILRQLCIAMLQRMDANNESANKENKETVIQVEESTVGEEEEYLSPPILSQERVREIFIQSTHMDYISMEIYYVQCREVHTNQRRKEEICEKCTLPLRIENPDGIMSLSHYIDLDNKSQPSSPTLYLDLVHEQYSPDVCYVEKQKLTSSSTLSLPSCSSIIDNEEDFSILGSFGFNTDILKRWFSTWSS